jgi:ABC-type branched-subunit amino acid transport system ATPase component
MRNAAIAAPDRESDTPMESMLSIRDVRISYGDSVVVDAGGVDVPPGQIVCLMGRNGAGKTTLMKAIMGTLPLRGGSISLMGRDMRQWQPYRRARAGIGYVPQGRGIFPYLTVMENLLIGLEPLKGKDDGQMDEVLTLSPAANNSSSPLAACWSRSHACCFWMSPRRASSRPSSSRSKKSSPPCAARCRCCW